MYPYAFCKRPSFNKFIHNSKPYYSKVEVINLIRNMNIDIDINNLINYNHSNIEKLTLENNDFRIN